MKTIIIKLCSIILAMSVNIFGFNVTSCPRQEDDGDVTFLQNALCHRELENKLNFSAIDVRTEPKIKNFENQKTKVQSNANSQLLVWLKDMKNIWKDFPVETYERRKPATPIKYFDVCENDKKFEQLKLTSNGNLSNSEVLIFNENDSTCFSKLGVAKINGTFIEGYLNGMATIFFHNGSFIRAPFLNGSISGLLRKFSCQYGSCDFDYQPWNVPNRLEEVSFYTDGFRVGPAWQFKIGGGFLVGEVDHAGDLTGPDLVYSYPDFKTLLVGHFAKGVMISAKESQLTGIKFDRRSKIPNLVYDKLLLRKSKNIFTFDPSNKNPQIAQNPLQPDPYESKRIYVGKSTIPGAGSGVFARHPGKRGMLVGFYNGVRKTKLEARLTKDDRQSSYMIDNDWAIADQVLDVPPTMRSLSRYRASLGHLVNHGSTPNAWFGMIDHPRFGKIRSVVLTRDVEENEELLTHYGFLDKFVETEDTLKGIYNFGKLISQQTDVEYSKTMKSHLRFLKEKADQLKPAFDVLKYAASFFGPKGGH